MSYLTQLEGSLAFTRDLTYKEIHLLPQYADGPAFNHGTLLRLVTASHTEEIEAGTLTVITGTGIEPDTSDRWRASGLVAELETLLAALPADVQVDSGSYLQGRGDADADLWRVYVVGRKVIKVQARVTFLLSAYGLGSDDTIMDEH